MAIFTVMTKETLAQHERVQIPAECECGVSIREGQQYTGGGLMMCCAPCTKRYAEAETKAVEAAYKAEYERLLMVRREIATYANRLKETIQSR